MNTKEKFQKTIRRDLKKLEKTNPTLKRFLELALLPILSLFPDFFLGIHYLGKSYGIVKQIVNQIYRNSQSEPLINNSPD